MVTAQTDRWQLARISRLERISRVDINTSRELEEIMATLEPNTGVCNETEKGEISRRRKRKFMGIAVPCGIITALSVIVCVVCMVTAGKDIAYRQEMADYYVREVEMNKVLSVILQEYRAVTLTMTGERTHKYLSRTFDFTDKEIEVFLPDNTLVKWTILNMLRDYRSSNPGTGPFHEKLIKHARFYLKVIGNLKYTIQAIELSLDKRQGWKMAYDLQLMSRQHTNTRMLVITLNALKKCFEKSRSIGTNTNICMDPNMIDVDSFTSVERFVTDMCSVQAVLQTSRTGLSKSYKLLKVLHQRVLDYSYSSDESLLSLYETFTPTNKPLTFINETTENGDIIPTSNSTELPESSDLQSKINTTNSKVTGDIIDEPVEGTTPLADTTTDEHNIEQETHTVSNTLGVVVTSTMRMSSISTDVTVKHDASENTMSHDYTLGDFIDIYNDLSDTLEGNMQSNIETQRSRNQTPLNDSILGFCIAAIALLLIGFLTVIFVSIIRRGSEVVVYVGDWLKNLTDDLNNQRDTLNAISKKVVPHRLTPKVDIHLTKSRMIPYHSKEATFLKFSISRFTSYFSLFTTSQTVHILTLVMELIDERIDQYDVISVSSMGHQQIVFSDTCYNQRATHASEIANLALDIMSCCSDLEIGRQPPYSKLHITIGIHSGQCIGMLYVRNSVYDFVVTGSALDVLQKVHKTAMPNRVQITETTYTLLESLNTYSMYVRGNINVKVGKDSNMKETDCFVYTVYWLNGRRISTGTSDCDSMCSRIGSWLEIERKPLYRLDEVEGVYEPINKTPGKLYQAAVIDPCI